MKRAFSLIVLVAFWLLAFWPVSHSPPKPIRLLTKSEAQRETRGLHALAEQVKRHPPKPTKRPQRASRPTLFWRQGRNKMNPLLEFQVNGGPQELQGDWTKSSNNFNGGSLYHNDASGYALWWDGTRYLFAASEGGSPQYFVAGTSQEPTGQPTAAQQGAPFPVIQYPSSAPAPPQSPTNLTATLQSDVAHLAWTASPTANVKYIVKRGVAANAINTVISSVKGIVGTAFVDTETPSFAGQTLYYTVTAMLASDNSSTATKVYSGASNTASVAVPAANPNHQPDTSNAISTAPTWLMEYVDGAPVNVLPDPATWTPDAYTLISAPNGDLDLGTLASVPSVSNPLSGRCSAILRTELWISNPLGRTISLDVQGEDGFGLHIVLADPVTKSPDPSTRAFIGSTASGLTTFSIALRYGWNALEVSYVNFGDVVPGYDNQRLVVVGRGAPIAAQVEGIRAGVLSYKPPVVVPGTPELHTLQTGTTWDGTAGQLKKTSRQLTFTDGLLTAVENEVETVIDTAEACS